MTAIRTTQVNLIPGMIDFGIGQPGFDILPLTTLQEATAHRFAQADPYFLNYGYEQGDGYWRLALAQFLTAKYGLPVRDDHLFLTAGASQGLDLICTLFTQPGDTIFVEEPSYFLALRIFADHRLKVVSLPTDGDGLVVDALEAQLAEQRPVFLYTIPSFQNPTGATLSQERRARLVELSREFDFLIVADEVYHLLAYAAPPPPPLAAFADDAPILGLGSFSKVLAPGLRLGWVHGAPARLERLVLSGLVDSGGGLNPFGAAVVRSALELGLEETYLDRLKTTYGARVAALSQALRAQLPAAEFVEPRGGFFFWLRLPETVDAEQLLPAARQQNVSFQPGIRFSSRRGLRSHLRLSFAFYDIPELVEGAARLAQTFEGWIETRA